MLSSKAETEYADTTRCNRHRDEDYEDCCRRQGRPVTCAFPFSFKIVIIKSTCQFEEKSEAGTHHERLDEHIHAELEVTTAASDRPSVSFGYLNVEKDAWRLS